MFFFLVQARTLRKQTAGKFSLPEVPERTLIATNMIVFLFWSFREEHREKEQMVSFFFRDPKKNTGKTKVHVFSLRDSGKTTERNQNGIVLLS